jgi:UDPglucose--hexose-1-phosphate uridylyltransferase
MNIHHTIEQLLNYAIAKDLITTQDKTWAANTIISKLNLPFFNPPPKISKEKLPQYPSSILSEISSWAIENKIIADSSMDKELLQTAIMGIFVQRPSDFINAFHKIVKEKNIKAAAKWMYEKERQADYIKVEMVQKNINWKVKTVYGNLDLAINLSKPEKTIEEIAQIKAFGAKALNQYTYPKCVLCPQNEGYAGRLDYSARQNARLLPLTLAKEKWYFQFSPYVYYNEHCIVLAQKHSDMEINEKSFVRFADFLDIFPHYFIGSNADLPIVGGSILNHDHYQGGNYTFPLHKAKIYKSFKLKNFPNVRCFILNWPLCVIRIVGKPKDVCPAASLIFDKWKNYSDDSAMIRAFDANVRHNTITPLARKVGKQIHFDLVLRNNATSADFPDGIFHTRKQYQHIKRENIGLIESLGMAILPGRLKSEMKKVASYLICKNLTEMQKDEEVQKHYEWAKEISDRYEVTAANADTIIRKEIGLTFQKALECCGVFARGIEGRAAFERFLQVLDK